MNDFRFALRQLRKSPGFTALAIITLALGIGVNSAIFALVNGVVLRPMVPLRPAEVVNIFTARQNTNHDYRQFSHTEYRDLRENGGDLFTDLAALEFAVAGTGRDHEMRRSFAFLTSENFFSLIGVPPVRGRFYTAEECRPNANVPVVVASYAFWKRMGGRDDFVGSNLQINGQPYTVIGITPDGFSGVSALVAPDIWLPLGVHSHLGSAFADSESLHDLAEPKNYALNLTARLRPGLTIETAKARLAPLTQRFNAIQPSNAEGARDLQLHEPSRFSISTSPEDDGPVTLIGALLMGMAGAVLLIASLNLANMLLARGTARSKEIALRLAVGASRWRIVRQLLCEGLLLAICGGLVTEMDFSLIRKDPAEARRLIFETVRRARDLPGVRTAALGTMLPYGNFTNSRRIMSMRETLPTDPKAPDPGAGALFTATTPGYFDAIGVKLLRGRDFTEAEAENRDMPRVAIIDDAMAKKIFPNMEAVGQHIRYTLPPKDGSPNDLLVVGVVSSHRHDVQNDTLNQRLFVPLSQGYNGNIYLHVRLATKDRRAVAAFIPTMRQTLRSIDPDLPILSIAPFVDLTEKSVGLWIVRLGALLFGVFGGIALLLAVVGVYGVKAYAVACRTREIGIRMALGAHRRDIFALIMRQGAIQTALAVTIGLLFSLAAGRILARILYQVSPSDPFALVISGALLAAAAMLACFFPARRATHVEPLKALRTE